MRERQVANVRIFCSQLELVADELDVRDGGQKVAIAEHDALGVARSAGGITDCKSFIQIVLRIFNHIEARIPVRLHYRVELHYFDVRFLGYIGKFGRDHLIKAYNLAQRPFVLSLIESSEDASQAFIRAEQRGELRLVQDDLQHFIAKCFI